MRAAEWDTDAEIGGGWTIKVERHTDGAVATLAAPVTLDLWAYGLDPVTAPPTLTVAGVIAVDLKSATLTISKAQVDTLGCGRFEHRLIVGDPAAGPQVMTRGWFIVRGRVDDL